jgi:hypothetical protein
MALILLIIAFSQVSTANATFGFYRTGDSIYMEGPSCEELAEQLDYMGKWTRSLNEKATCHVGLAEPRKTFWGGSDKQCAYEISHCLPDHVRKYFGTKPDFSGPNCWNLALVMKELVPFLRYSTPEEMSFYMAPPFCRQLGITEKIQPGDLGAIRAGDDSEVHGFIYVSDKIVYSKNGYRNMSPFHLQNLEDVKYVYSGFLGLMPRQLANYRCKSLDEAISLLKPEFKEAFNEVYDLENCLQTAAFNRGVIVPEQLVEAVSTSIKGLLFYLEKEKQGYSHAAPDDLIQIKILELRLYAIHKQLGYVRQPTPIILDLVKALGAWDKN